MHINYGETNSISIQKYTIMTAIPKERL
jgi:hypothetical protein